MSMPDVGVVGAGSWGTALALSLARTGGRVRLWAHRREHAESLRDKRENERYLPGRELPAEIVPTWRAKDLVECDTVFFVVPTSFFRGVAELFQGEGALKLGAPLVSCSKGIEAGSSLSMTEVLGEVFPANPAGVLSGPNHAEEVARAMPTAAVVAAQDEAVVARLQGALNHTRFRCYSSTDVRGIEWAGAMKNVFAIAAGICDGLGLGDNAKAALLTRAMAEMVRLGTARGGDPATFYGLSGVGDLIATCFSEHSRNLRVGRQLGGGIAPEDLGSKTGMVAEGIPNTKNLYLFAQSQGIRAPIIDACHAILYEERPARAALEDLLSRDPRPENS